MINNEDQASSLTRHQVDDLDLEDPDESHSIRTTSSRQEASPPPPNASGCLSNQGDMRPPFRLGDHFYFIAPQGRGTGYSTLHYSGDLLALRRLIREQTSHGVRGTIVRDARPRPTEDSMQWCFDFENANTVIPPARSDPVDGRPSSSVHPGYCVGRMHVPTQKFDSNCHQSGRADSIFNVCSDYAVLDTLIMRLPDGSLDYDPELEANQGKTSIEGTMFFRQAMEPEECFEETVWKEGSQGVQWGVGVFPTGEGENSYSSSAEVLDKYYFEFVPDEDKDLPKGTIFGSLDQYGSFQVASLP